MAAEILNVVLSVFANYSFLICLFSGLLGGIVWLLVLAGLAANGVFSVWTLIIFFYIGIVFCDIGLFKFGQIKSLSYLKKHKLIYKGYQKVTHMLQKYSKNRDMVILFFSKFIYGSYAPLIMHFGRKGMNFKKFVISDLIINAIWMIILIPLGWFAGKGFRFFLGIENSIDWAILSAILLLIILYLVKKLFSVFVSKDVICKIKQKIK
jgi:membrane protein DedA with SNARE-associated domain